MATEKQLNFCNEYIKDYNATRAAIRAGYSEKTAAVQASRLLRSPDVLTIIKEKQKQLVKSSCLSEEKIISDLQQILARCMTPVPVMKWDSDSHSYVETGVYGFDSKGALNAIKLLGQHLGMFKDKIDIDGKFAVGKVADILKQLEDDVNE